MASSTLPGFAEIVLILFITLTVFTASKLPAIATAAGKAIERVRARTRAVEPDDIKDS